MTSVRPAPLAPHPGLAAEIVPFTAGDGMALNVVHVTGPRPATRGPVLLVHGAGVRANLFNPPTRATIVSMLIDHGYDVWLENWRASIDLPPNEWTLDQAAVHDHPAAVGTVLNHTGARHVKALVHCQGSTSFVMSAAAGLLPEVPVIVSNAVSLHPRIPERTRVKYRACLPVLDRLVDYLDPQWGRHAPTMTARAVTAWVRATHHECDNLVCRLASFTYGVGAPTMWSHAQLDEATHDWLEDEFASVPVSFFQQMYRSVLTGQLVTVDGRPELPRVFGADPPRTDARFAFFAGADNICFLPESQRATHAYFDRHARGRHTLHVVPGYGHLDMFFGRDAGRDVFPLMIQELDKES